MENKYYGMKSWRIDMVKSKRGKIKHIAVYTHSLIVMIIVFTICMIAAGAYMINTVPNILRISLVIIGLMISLTYLWASLNSKKRLIDITQRGYKPASEIDADRYVIAMEYFGISDMVKAKHLEKGGSLTSNFEEKRKIRERKSIFSGLKNRMMKKATNKKK